MAEELKLDVKDFAQMSEIHDDDRFMMTKAANAHFAGSMTLGIFKEKVLAPIIESSKPNGMGCEIFGSIDEYNALTDLDPKTMYVIIEEGKITQAFLGEYPFSVGGGGDVSGIPIEQVFVDLDAMVLELGESKQLTASYEPSDATNTTLSWTTSNRLVAKVANGLVTSVGKGECIIKVKARSGAFAECAITVEITLVGLSFSSDNNKLVSGFTTQLEPIATPENATLALTYSSDDTSKATVDAATGVVTPVATTGEVTINAVNKNGIRASLPMTIVPFAVSVSCQGIDEADNSVQSIFSVWKLAVKGLATHYKYAETVKGDDGIESTLQSTGWIEIPADKTIQIELYAEFGYKYVNWTFKNAAGQEEQVVCPLIYKEPNMVNYSFNLAFECKSVAEAAAITMDIPYFKYDKKVCMNERNDDGYRPLCCEGLRYCNREVTEKKKSINWREGYLDSKIESMLDTDKFRSPRRLGYSDGCGNLKIFSFDLCTMIAAADGTLEWDMKPGATDPGNCGSSGMNANKDVILKLKDYGGRTLIHNMNVLPSDAAHYTPKYEHDYTYTLQRDTETIEKIFGYTPNHFANPDGKGYYTYPCIKSPKTYMISAGGEATKIFTDEWAGKYGMPAHRKAYSVNDDLSVVPLSEIRNCLIFSYHWNADAPYVSDLWKRMIYDAINKDERRFKAELQHGIGNHEANYRYFDGLNDYIGVDGMDCLMFCSGDEFVEYMYYQRVAKITKTIEGNIAKFNIAISIPDCLSFKTYSVKAHNLPEDVIVTHSNDVTYFAKNLQSGLMNFGYSNDIKERAERFYRKYLANPTMDNLDKAQYFCSQLGELNTFELPVFDQTPSITEVTFNLPQENLNAFIVSVRNGNKEWGEAHTLEVSDTADFAEYSIYPILYRKFFDKLDIGSCDYNFKIKLKAVFNQDKTYYFRYRNRYGISNVYQKSFRLSPLSPVVEAVVDRYYTDSEAKVQLNLSNVLQIRYAVNGTYTLYKDASEYIVVTLSEGANELIFEGKDNLGNTVTANYTTYKYAVDWESKLYPDPNLKNSKVIADVYSDGFSKIPTGTSPIYNPGTPIVDTNMNPHAEIFSLDHKAQAFNGIQCHISAWPDKTLTTGDNSAIYPDAYIGNSRTGTQMNSAIVWDNNKNFRTGFRVKNLEVGKYIAKFFIRNTVPFNKAHGIAFVKDMNNSEKDYLTYDYSKVFCMSELYYNKDKTIDVPFEITSLTDFLLFGIDRRYDIYGAVDGGEIYSKGDYPLLNNGDNPNSSTNDFKLHFNLVHLVKVKG